MLFPKLIGTLFEEFHSSLIRLRCLIEIEMSTVIFVVEIRAILWDLL